MVQKSGRPSAQAAPARRGRPRAFEADAALAQAMDAFWSDGFAATSLDDISAATGLNRPSLYGAFGDKRALYLQAYGRYRKRMDEIFAPLLAAQEPLRVKLKRVLATALDLYTGGPSGPRGCFTVLSAASEAIADPDLNRLVSEAIERTDRALEKLLAAAHAAGELPQGADPRRLARIASATFHTLSIRARARIPRGDIEPIIDDVVTTICGPEDR
jgi:TetR/AcrR family transcriptional regulator, copper-responsive repressor